MGGTSGFYKGVAMKAVSQWMASSVKRGVLVGCLGMGLTVVTVAQSPSMGQAPRTGQAPSMGQAVLGGGVTASPLVPLGGVSSQSGGVLSGYSNALPIGKVGVVLSLARVLDVGKAIGAAQSEIPHFDLEWTTQVDPNTDLFAVIGLHSHEGKSEIHIENVYLQRTGLFDGLTLRAGRQFVPFGYMAQLHTEMSPFATVPAVTQQYFAEGNLAATGISFLYGLPVPFFASVQAASWTHTFSTPAEGFGVTNRMGQYRVLVGSAITDTLEWSASVHAMNGDGPTYQAQFDRVELVGSDFKLDWDWGPDHKVTVLGEALGMNRTVGAKSYQRSGGYVAAWVTQGPWDYGIKSDWVELPTDTLQRVQSVSGILNIRQTQSSVLKMEYKHDTSGANQHQFALNYVLAMGANNHPVIR